LCEAAPVTEDHRDLNRAFWDERVAHHRGSAFYDTAGVIAGTHDPIRPFEDEELGSVAGRDLVHLQCHFGLDTIGWARRGARATGLDFSPTAITTARDVAGEAGVEVTFVEGDVYDAPGLLGAESFDIVYTGFGALIWLPDIERWASTVAELLRTQGVLYLAEFHPFAHVFADHDRSLAHGYFDRGPARWGEGGTYADVDGDVSFQHNVTMEWQHTVGDILNAVVGAGLVIEAFHEHDYTLFPRWPDLVAGAGGRYDLPHGMPSIPLMFSLRARQPG
jgi:SAM-dependent methyltransferase